MKILITFIDGSATPAIRGLKLLDKNEDYLVLIYRQRFFDDKNIVKDRADLPPARVVEAAVDNHPTTIREKVELVFEHLLHQLKIPRNTQIVLLPTPGRAVNRYRPSPNGGYRAGFLADEYPSETFSRVENTPSPILPALVAQAVIDEARVRHMELKTILVSGETLLEDKGGVLNQHSSAVLSVSEWMAISKMRSERVKLPTIFSDFLTANAVTVTWTEAFGYSKGVNTVCAGFAEAAGRVFRLVCAGQSENKELELVALKSILTAQRSGVELPTLVLAKVLDTELLSDTLSTLTASPVRVIDVGENPLRDPAGSLESFLND